MKNTNVLDLTELLSKADMMTSHEHDPSLGQRRAHKYTSRYWNGNSWVYEYPGDEGKGAPNAAPSSGPPNSSGGAGGGLDSGGSGQQPAMGEPQEEDEGAPAAPSKAASPPTKGSPPQGGSNASQGNKLNQWKMEQLQLLAQLEQALTQQGQDITIINFAKQAVQKITDLSQVPEFDRVMESLGFQQYIADKVIHQEQSSPVTSQSLEDNAIKALIKELRK